MCGEGCNSSYMCYCLGEMVQPYVCFSLLWISVFLSVGGIAIFFFLVHVCCLCGGVILDARMGLCDSIILCIVSVT